jgi:hypothetical protein
LLHFVQDVQRYYDTTNVDGHLPANCKSHALIGQVAEGNHQHTGCTPQPDYNPNIAESDDLDACIEAFNAYTYNNGSKPLTIPRDVYRQMAMYSPVGLALLLADREAYLKANPNPAPYTTPTFPLRPNTYGVPQGQPTHMVYDTRAPNTQQRTYPTNTPCPNRYNNPPPEATRVTPITGGAAHPPVNVPSRAMQPQQTGQQLPKQYTKIPADTQANLFQTGDQMLAQSLQDQEAEDFPDDAWDGTFQGHIVITDDAEEDRFGLKVQIQSDRPRRDSVIDSVEIHAPYTFVLQYIILHESHQVRENDKQNSQ